jgi:hypothetical protein
MDSILGYILMAAVSLPISWFLARGCLRGVMRIVTGGERRDVL